MDESMVTAAPLPVNEQRLLDFDKVLEKYKAGKKRLESRVVAAENWWKMRNEAEARKEDAIGWDDSFRAKSAWLHNVLISKHADAMENYPEPIVLPREPNDRQQARTLSAVLPVVLEQAHFEAVYDANMWQKLKTGTGVYQVTWDAEKLNGLGDIAIRRVDLLSIFWEPGIQDIQRSRYVFHVELQDNEVLEAQYPQLKEKLKGQKQSFTRFLYDDAVPTDGKSAVIDVYYKQQENGRTVLHYCKYVGDQVLASTENDAVQQAQERAQRADELDGVAQELAGKGINPAAAIGGQMQDVMAEPVHVGLYDHGLYPFVFDPLWPIEGSPCGYGYVDISMNPQIQLDLLDTAFLKNAMNGASPRYFKRAGSSVNEDQFKDVNNTFVEVTGTLDDTGIRPVDYAPLAGNYLGFYQQKVSELRETSGNTESSNGVSTSGVTAASAIAALQEASGKTSRDAVRSSYRAFSEITEMLIELIRQFYDLPRMFRIQGENGMEQFAELSNAGMVRQPVEIGMEDMGYRLPVFDIKVKVQKRNAYTRVSQNELALQLFNMGFFNPEAVAPAMTCLEMMDFEGKDELTQRLAQNGTLYQQLQAMAMMALGLAQRYEPQNVGMVMQLAPSLGMEQQMGAQPINPAAVGGEEQESGVTKRAREQSNKTTEANR
ncbi:MAG: hypothetical protein IJI06_08900 [Oscillospiraceae bacterium]|nr:hypothetical protein [Oscillospiraceae bacterium]